MRLPTRRQVEAYIYRYFSHPQRKISGVAKLMGITPRAARQLLKRLRANCPELFEGNCPYYRIFRYSAKIHDSKIARRF